MFVGERSGASFPSFRFTPKAFVITHVVYLYASVRSFVLRPGCDGSGGPWEPPWSERVDEWHPQRQWKWERCVVPRALPEAGSAPPSRRESSRGHIRGVGVREDNRASAVLAGIQRCKRKASTSRQLTKEWMNAETKPHVFRSLVLFFFHTRSLRAWSVSRAYSFSRKRSVTFSTAP